MSERSKHDARNVIVFLKEEWKTTMKYHSNLYCQAVKFRSDHDQATMGNDGTLW